MRLDSLIKRVKTKLYRTVYAFLKRYDVFFRKLFSLPFENADESICNTVNRMVNLHQFMT